MSKIVQAIFHLWAVALQKDYKAKVIALHIAQNALYERKGIDALYPDLKEKYLILAKRMKALQMPIYFVEGFRTVPRQNSLSKGVTNAKGLFSWHQHCLAFDIAFKNHNWNPPSEDWWEVLGLEGEKIGLIWGGRWKMKDYGHFQSSETERINLKELADYFEVDNLTDN